MKTGLPIDSTGWLFKGWVDGHPALGWQATLAYLSLPVILVCLCTVCCLASSTQACGKSKTQWRKQGSRRRKAATARAHGVSGLRWEQTCAYVRRSRAAVCELRHGADLFPPTHARIARPEARHARWRRRPTAAARGNEHAVPCAPGHR
jgi:hypothetical protein